MYKKDQKVGDNIYFLICTSLVLYGIYFPFQTIKEEFLLYQFLVSWSWGDMDMLAYL